MNELAPITHGDPIAPVILGVTSILAFAVIGRVLARRLGQPTVLGELIMGILLGNIAWYLGVDLITVLREGPRVFDVVNLTLAGSSIDVVAESIFGGDKAKAIVRIITGANGGQVMQVAHVVDVFSRYGVIFMLFVVGLQTDIGEMRVVGADSIRVALIGVVAPVVLGFGLITLLRPDMSFNSHLFVAATLAATSIGITAAALKDLGRDRSREGHIVVGAAIGDDILGLVILAVVSGIIVSGSVNIAEIATVVTVSSLFLVTAASFGPVIVRFAASILGRLDIVEAKMFTSYLFVMLLAWMANLAGLATIIGAFAAGIILHDSYFREHVGEADERVVSIRELIMPLEVILVPIFFILVGIQVKLETFFSLPVLTLSAGLLVVAVIGKILSGVGAFHSNAKWIVAVGMVPRGEVGLVFATIGRTLGVIDDSVFAAIALMVIVTTVIAPPWLKLVVNRCDARTRHELMDGDEGS
jgi:Kef-type K+ transport system membrane component KefB